MGHQEKEINNHLNGTGHTVIALKEVTTQHMDDNNNNESAGNNEMNIKGNPSLKKDLLGFFYGLLGSLTIAIASACVQVRVYVYLVNILTRHLSLLCSLTSHFCAV